MNPYERRGSGVEAEAATAKIGNMDNAKAGFNMRGAEAEWQAKVARITPHPHPHPRPRSVERFMPSPPNFRGGKGAWLSSHRNPAKTSGGLDKADYERLTHLLSQSRILYDASYIRLRYALCWGRFFMI